MPGPPKPCPRCGPDGDVATSAPGVAACGVCLGGFMSSKTLLPALLAAGIAPAELRELIGKGSKLRPCPTCPQLLTTFAVRRETLHACTQCNAMWVDDGAVLRFGGVDPKTLAPLPVSPRRSRDIPSGEGVPAEGPMQPLDEPLPPKKAPTGSFAPVTLGAAPVVEDAPYVPEVGSFNEGGSSGTSIVSLVLKLGVAAIALGGMYFAVTTAFMKGEPTPVGGGYEVLFWDQPVKEDAPDYNGAPVKRWVSPWGTNTLEVIYVPGGGGPDVCRNGKPEGVTAAFHTWNRMVGGPASRDGKLFYCELEFVDERDPNKTNKNIGGYCKYWFNDSDGWLLCGYSDSNLFARSGKSTSFTESFRKRSK